MNEDNSCIERHGVVIGVPGGDYGRVRVRLESAPGCTACASRSACGSAAGGSQVIEVVLPSARLGDAVTLAIPAATLSAAALLGYLLPSLGLLAGALAADLAWASDAAAVIGAAVGLCGGLLVARACGEGEGEGGFDFARRLTPVLLSSPAQQEILPYSFEPGDTP